MFERFIWLAPRLRRWDDGDSAVDGKWEIAEKFRKATIYVRAKFETALKTELVNIVGVGSLDSLVMVFNCIACSTTTISVDCAFLSVISPSK